ncbi:MAG: hypothetical protein Q8P93_00845 [bacterium]|nr:hypothetical protein [bacterium]
MAKKKTIKKIRSATKTIAKKTSKIAGALGKQWKKEEPQRKKLKKTANNVLKNSYKISSDVIKTIRKDIGEMKRS